MILHSASQVIVAYLTNLGILKGPRTVQDWNVQYAGYYDFLPDTPNNAVCVYNTTGPLETRPMDGSQRVVRPGIQITIRSKLYNTAFLKYKEITGALDAIYKTSVTVDGKEYQVHAVKSTTPFLPMGQQEGGSNLLFSTNGIVSSYGEI